MAIEMPLAFFSYARDDSQFALQLAKDLKSSGVSVWLDQLDIRPGQRWDKAVEHALAGCPSVLAILSPSSVSSTNVMDEVSFALEEGKVLIPILHRECKIPFRLRRLQYVDFRAEYGTGLRDLLNVMGVDQNVESVAAASESTAWTEETRRAEEERNRPEGGTEQQRKVAEEQQRREEQERRVAEARGGAQEEGRKAEEARGAEADAVQRRELRPGEPTPPQVGFLVQRGGEARPVRVGLILALAVSVLVVLLAWLGSRVLNHSRTGSPMPVIEQFAVAPASIHTGDTARLNWSVRGAARVTIEPGIGAMPASGGFSIFPTQTTTYEIKALGDGGTGSAKATVSVTSPPEPRTVLSLTAAPSRLAGPGGPVVLSWSVTGATAASIDHGIGEVPSSGRLTVQPKETTTYTLTARGPPGDRTTTATVEVGTRPTAPAEPPVIRLWAESAIVEYGQNAILHWNVINATRTSVDWGLGPQPFRGTKSIPVFGPSTWTLTAYGSGGTRTAEVTVNVRPAPGARQDSASGGHTRPLPAGRFGHFYKHLFTTKVPQPRFEVTLGELPDGLVLFSNGVLNGTPTRAGEFIFTVRAINDSTSEAAAFSIHIDPPQ